MRLSFLRVPVWLPCVFMLLVLLGALTLQHVFGWLPCPLCILQRLSSIGMLGCLVASAFVSGRRASLAALFLASAFAAAGLVAGGAHLWLLAQPASGSCGPGLARFVGQLVDALPGSDWLLEGAGACEDARYQVLGLPLPAWSMAAHAFAGALGWASWLNPRRRKCN